MKNLLNKDISILGVDFDPEVIRAKCGVLPVKYGDGEDFDFLNSLGLEKVKTIALALPDVDSSLNLLRGVREVGFQGCIIGVTRDEVHTQALFKEGIEEVLNPFIDAADAAVTRVVEK